MPSSSATSPVPDYEKQFLHIYNNADKAKPDRPWRERGFVVLARGTSSLARLQDLCFVGKRHDWNKVLTARYRLKPPGIFGTLLVSFLSDLKKIFANEQDFKGNLKPAPSESVWRELAVLSLSFMGPNEAWPPPPPPPSPRALDSVEYGQLEKKYSPEVVRDIFNIARESRGDLTAEQLKLILDAFALNSNKTDSDKMSSDKTGPVLSRGDRLVLFAEVSEAASLEEWNAAKETLFNRLPERVGLVLSGAPADFKLTDDDNAADPHFLDLSLPERQDSGATTKSVVKFSNASFHRDQPASRDELDVNDYANALARFILHKQTLPPLTVGIHGRWGKGKSSFMKMVDNALVKHGEVNIQRRKVWRWQLTRPNPSDPAGNWFRKLIRRFLVQSETPARTEKWNDLVIELIKAEPGVQKLLTEKEPAEEKAKAERQSQINVFKDRQKRESRLWQTMVRKARQNVVSVWFNAWQFEDAKQTWAGLASQISERMESALPWHSRQWLKIGYSIKERKSELVLNVLIPLAVVLAVAGLVWFGALDRFRPAKPNSDLARLLGLLLPSSGLLTIWFASTQFLKVTQPVSERVLSYVRLPNYREQMGFQHRVKDDLRFVYQFLCKRRKNCRLVIYIDDLDRCSEGKIMELLQAINLILASCEFFVFVGMDTEMIYRAIGSHYQGKIPDRFAENYLRKIIQISFYLPETKPEDRLTYVNSLFSWQARAGLAEPTEPTTVVGPITPKPTVTPPPPPPGTLAYDLDRVLDLVSIQYEDVEDTADELKALHEYVLFLDDNPREIKRLVNLHRLIKILLQKPNTSWPKERQRKLVKWLVFCDVWPHLVDDILAGKKKRDALYEKVKNNTPTETEKNAILAEIETSHSANCLDDLAVKIKEYAESQKKSLPYLEGLRKFVDLKTEDVLSSKDIDDDFQRAAYLSQLVRESPEMPPFEEANGSKDNGYGLWF